MAEEYRFFNTTTDDPREYDAGEFAEVLATFFANGVISGLEVTKTSSGLSVSVGYAIINGYWYHLDAAKTLTPISNTTAYTGMVIVRLNLNTRSITAMYKKGTTITAAGNIHEIPLAEVKMAANSTTPTEVTDCRTISSVQAKAEISSADVLEKLLGVCGSGSALDADMLDGQHGTYYRSYNNLTNKPILYGSAEPSSTAGTNGNIYIQY